MSVKIGPSVHPIVSYLAQVAGVDSVLSDARKEDCSASLRRRRLRRIAAPRKSTAIPDGRGFSGLFQTRSGPKTSEVPLWRGSSRSHRVKGKYPAVCLGPTFQTFKFRHFTLQRHRLSRTLPITNFPPKTTFN